MIIANPAQTIPSTRALKLRGVPANDVTKKQIVRLVLLEQTDQTLQRLKVRSIIQGATSIKKHWIGLAVLSTVHKWSTNNQLWHKNKSLGLLGRDRRLPLYIQVGGVSKKLSGIEGRKEGASEKVKVNVLPLLRKSHFLSKGGLKLTWNAPFFSFNTRANHLRNNRTSSKDAQCNAKRPLSTKFLERELTREFVAEKSYRMFTL